MFNVAVLMFFYKYWNKSSLHIKLLALFLTTEMNLQLSDVLKLKFEKFTEQILKFK